MPAWAAVLAWLVAFILISIVLQKMVTPVSAWIDRLVQK